MCLTIIFHVDTTVKRGYGLLWQLISHKAVYSYFCLNFHDVHHEIPNFAEKSSIGE